ncbi:MbtH family NRPS accessory protein [Streptomyces sp. NPDC056405]|uniref:MbtH family NRPS accessory protein n=1 Tax=Streptomyces sp. NPDC056405 TaxID=3345811 RepID=UPI0035D62DCB
MSDDATTAPDHQSRPTLVVVNAAGQYALWPSAVTVPDGWNAAFGPAGQQVCRRFVDAMWRDIRPTVRAGTAPLGPVPRPGAKRP